MFLILTLACKDPIDADTVKISEDAKNSNDLKESISQTLHNVNKTLDKHEVLNNIVLLKENWTVENKFLTPTMKIKRNSIEKKYQENYTTWYEKDKVIEI